MVACIATPLRHLYGDAGQSRAHCVSDRYPRTARHAAGPYGSGNEAVVVS